MQPKLRRVAQLGRALRSGRRGRRFESCHADYRNPWGIRENENGLSGMESLFFWFLPRQADWDCKNGAPRCIMGVGVACSMQMCAGDGIERACTKGMRWRIEWEETLSLRVILTARQK